MSQQVPLAEPTEALKLGHEVTLLALVTIMCIPLQMMATDLGVGRIIGGLTVLGGIGVAGVVLARLLPMLKLPSVAWVSIVGIATTIPGTPWAGAVLHWVESIDFLALTPPCLAYAAMAITAREISIARTSGWKILIVGVLVLLGTYIGSVLIAELMLGVS